MDIICKKAGGSIKCKKECLLLVIEHIRKKLIHVGFKDGYTSKETIRLSQRLDKVILKYQKLK